MRLRALAVAAAMAIAAGAALAAPPPDDFRQRLVDALAPCTAAYGALASNNDVSTSDDDEMRYAAREQSDETRRLLALWSHMDPDEVAEAVWDASLELEAEGFDDEELLDLAIYCEDELADMFDTIDAREYTP